MIQRTSLLVAAGALAALVAAPYAPRLHAQQPAQAPVELLWPAGAPGALGEAETDRPSLTLYPAPADRANGTAVVVVPGGGYQHLAMNHEGHQVAQWLNSLGISAFVLKYRLGPQYHHPTMLNDAQRALRIVRSRAREWNVDPARIGMLGFSAGGHLTSTAGTHFDAGRPGDADPVERVSSRPDFLVLIYPVITMETAFTHAGSRRNLLGQNPTPEMVQLLSNEKQVSPRTPPTFLVHTSDDAAVPVANSLLFYQALHRAGVPAEMHIYETGRHGFGMAPGNPALSTWTDLLARWLTARGLLPASGSR